jgi:hypothetical protein
MIFNPQGSGHQSSATVNCNISNQGNIGRELQWGAVVNALKESSPLLSELALHGAGPTYQSGGARTRSVSDKNSVAAPRVMRQAFVGAGEARFFHGNARRCTRDGELGMVTSL